MRIPAATPPESAGVASPTARHRLEDAVAASLLALVALLPLAEGAGRLVGIGNLIPGSLPMVQHLTLLIAVAGGALAARNGRLLALSTATFLPEWLKAPAQTYTSAVGAAVCACLAYGSWTFASVEREAGDIVAFGLPVWLFVFAMSPGFAAIGLRMVWRSSDSFLGRAIALAGAGVPAALYLWEGLGDLPVLQWGVLVLLSGAILGLPIFAWIGGLAALLFWFEYTPVTAVPLAAYQLSGQPLLPAIPLFTLGGYILAEGGASQRLVRVFAALVGWMPGGLAVTTALAFAFFTSFTGASGVTILSLGGLLLPVLVKSRYSQRFSLGLVTASGSIGLLFPPSLAVILYGVYSRTPINELFLGGLLPGVLLVGLVALWGVRHGSGAGQVRPKFDGAEALRAASEAKWELLLPFVVIGGIFGGVVTLVEAAALTVLYAAVVECLVYRDLPVTRGLPSAAVECATLVGGVLLILGVALGFTNYLIDAQIPDRALEWVQTHIESKYVFLLALNALLLVVGCMMDIFSAILVVVPLIAPMGEAYGVDPVHLGIIFLANLELGYLTPPVGLNLFLSSYRFGQPLTRVYRSVLPFLLILLGGVLLITYVPALSLALVR
ncbi:MAG: TRAP transporter large permease subunit [Bryobacterales bacterium]|nr:TRAP transporter large permease subunit [Bryobacterales bacterium]MDE0628682.1 TRAP transporter large permease subunit [Bryobacterales bacterium]